MTKGRESRKTGWKQTGPAVQVQEKYEIHGKGEDRHKVGGNDSEREYHTHVLFFMYF